MIYGPHFFSIDRLHPHYGGLKTFNAHTQHFVVGYSAATASGAFLGNQGPNRN